MSLPDPPLPANLDLSGLEYMPLLVVRLRRSKAWLRAKRKPELGFYMMNLWTAAWMEKPAASLDDDDDVLADAAMCAPEKWLDVKAEVMAGFEKHADGRLYHAVLVEQAHIALAKRQKWKEKKRGQRGDAPQQAAPVPTTVPRDTGGTEGDEKGDTPGENPLRDGTGRDEREKPTTTEPVAARPADRPEVAVVDGFLKLRSEIWPQESRLPSPTLTLETQARQWLDQQMPAALLLEITERVMRHNAKKGQSAPSNFGFCRLSLESALTDFLQEIPPFLRRSGPAAPQDSPAAQGYLAAVEAWTRLSPEERATQPKPQLADFEHRQGEAA